MKIDLIRLVYNQVKSIDINLDVEINSKYLENTEIKYLSPVKVVGVIFKDNIDQIAIDLKISGTMTLIDSRSLEEVLYPFETNFNTILDENYQINQNLLDIEPILWENIVLEVPIRVVSDKPVPKAKGNGWELKDE